MCSHLNSKLMLGPRCPNIMHKFSSFYDIQIKSWAVHVAGKAQGVIIGGLGR